MDAWALVNVRTLVWCSFEQVWRRFFLLSRKITSHKSLPLISRHYCVRWLVDGVNLYINIHHSVTVLAGKNTTNKNIVHPFSMTNIKLVRSFTVRKQLQMGLSEGILCIDFALAKRMSLHWLERSSTSWDNNIVNVNYSIIDFTLYY